MYTIEDFLDRKICVLCDTDEQIDQLREMAGWEGKNDAFRGIRAPVLFFHRRDEGVQYGHTTYTRAGGDGIEYALKMGLQIVHFDDMNASACIFDLSAFNQMLGIGC